jgi:hypothetical protein
VPGGFQQLRCAPCTAAVITVITTATASAAARALARLRLRHCKWRRGGRWTRGSEGHQHVRPTFCGSCRVVCGARLETHEGECSRVDRGEDACTPLLSPVASCHGATARAAESPRGGTRARLWWMVVGSLLLGARISGSEGNLMYLLRAPARSYGHRSWRVTATATSSLSHAGRGGQPVRRGAHGGTAK